MTLNKFMHPKNPYKHKQPNFKDLAIKYEQFRQYTTQDEAGKVHIDFKDAKALKALSWALLKDDFNLDVDMPLDRLIPTIPLRLNYISWLADIVGKKKSVCAVDIGCGASCVYPLLAVKTQKWSFLATETDDMNFEYAKRNIDKNGLTEKISLVKVDSEGDIFVGLGEVRKYDFTMCNPPFFGSNLEAYAMTKTRNADRAEPSSVCTASESESITPGGEVEFVRKMIVESTNLKGKIRFFTTMLGKKSSVGILKEELRKHGIKNVGSYEFCQGRTMRWGLGWSYDSKVKFPKSIFQQSKTPEKGPLLIPIDRSTHFPKYEIQELGSWLLEAFTEFGIKYAVIMDCEAMWSASVSATENTWKHQRRKRRAQQRGESLPVKRLSPASTPDLNSNPEKSIIVSNAETSGKDNLDETSCVGTITNEERENVEIMDIAGLGKASESARREDQIPTKINDTIDAEQQIESVCSEEMVEKRSTESRSVITNPDSPTPPITVGEDSTASKECSDISSARYEIPTKNDDADDKDSVVALVDEETSKDVAAQTANVSEKKKSQKEVAVLFSAWFTFKYDKDEKIILEIKWLKGKSKESMHQVLQLIKNRLKLPSSH